MAVPWAAAFSAFGCAAAEYFHRYDKAVTFFLTPDMEEAIKMYQGMGLSAAWQELEERGYEELEKEGIPGTRFTSGTEYLAGTLDKCPPGGSGAEGPSRVNRRPERRVDSFERVYTTIYPAAARFPEAGYQITEVYVEAVAEKIKPVLPKHTLGESSRPGKPPKGTEMPIWMGHGSSAASGKWTFLRLATGLTALP